MRHLEAVGLSDSRHLCQTMMKLQIEGCCSRVVAPSYNPVKELAS